MTSGAQSFGGHSFSFEPPDLCVFSIVGDVSTEEAMTALEAINRSAEGRPYVLVLGEISKLGAVAPESRRALGKATRTPLHRGSAIVGASFHARVLLALLSKIMAFFGGARDCPTSFFTTESEARAWLDERRRVLKESGAPPP